MLAYQFTSPKHRNMCLVRLVIRDLQEDIIASLSFMENSNAFYRFCEVGTTSAHYRRHWATRRGGCISKLLPSMSFFDFGNMNPSNLQFDSMTSFNIKQNLPLKVIVSENPNDPKNSRIKKFTKKLRLETADDVTLSGAILQELRGRKIDPRWEPGTPNNLLFQLDDEPNYYIINGCFTVSPNIHFLETWLEIGFQGSFYFSFISESPKKTHIQLDVFFM